MAKVSWKEHPADGDYPAAAAYLSLLVEDSAELAQLVDRLRATEVRHYRANDILRASGLPLLPIDDPRVASDLKKVKRKAPLSPVLLIRGDLHYSFPLQIADGYHRVCASYHVDETVEVSGRIVDLPRTGRPVVG